MSHLYFLKGGQIATAESPHLTNADLLIENGTIVQKGQKLAPPAQAEIIDCTQKVILPGLFDMNVRLREPGPSRKETIASGSEAAINGGITGLVGMSDTSPAIDNVGIVKSVLNATESARIPILTAGCITKNREGKELASIGSMRNAGVRLITDCSRPIENPQVLRRAMQYSKDLDIIVASHCETPSLTGNGVMNEGRISYQLGLSGMHRCSEEICIGRDLRIAEATGGSLHIQNVSSSGSVDTIRWFKERGVSVTAEVSPHHLMFSEEDIGDYNTLFKTSPPFRTKADSAALIEGLKDGTLDIIASGHSPHTAFEKNLDFSSAPFGITGLDTALVSLFHHFIESGELGWDTLIKTYSQMPRAIMQVDQISICENSPANLTVFDTRQKTTFTESFMQSKSSNTPFLGQTLNGRITHVFSQGSLLLER